MQTENAAGASHPLRWFPEFLEFGKRRFRTQGRVLGACIAVGIVAGFGGVLFSLVGQVITQYTLEGVAGYHAAGPAGEVRFHWLPEVHVSFSPWLLLLIPPIGGLLSGFLVFRYAPEAEGHGTDAAIAAYHQGRGYIRPRVPMIKLISSALSIGTGGSGGREGPIAQIGAGFGSLLGSFLRFKPAERRILLAAGMGAGIAAIFRAPLAGTLFAAEILYFSPEFESEVILPTGLASVVSYCTFGAITFGLGGVTDPWRPLFNTPTNLTFVSAWELIPYLLLAVWVALLSMIYVRTFYGITHLFHVLRMPRMLKPALGAFLTGVVALVLFFAFDQSHKVLAVLAYGYGALQEGLSNETSLAAGILLAIALGKIVTTSLTIGSGGSGGVFGPSMVIGGCGGGALGVVLHDIWPALAPHPGTFVILGMAGFFAAAGKTPFSTLIIVSEMTGDYRLLLPALWVCTISFLLSDEQPLYRSQLESKSQSPAHHGSFVRAVLAGQTVASLMETDAEIPSLHPSDTMTVILERFDASTYPALPVVDAEQRLQGVIALEEIHLALQAANAGALLIAADLMRPLDRALRLDDRLDHAMELFVRYDLLVLPVTEDSGGRKLIGLVRRHDVAKIYLNKLHGEREEAKGADSMRSIPG